MNMEDIKWFFTGWGIKEIGALLFIGAFIFGGTLGLYIILG